MLIVRWVVSALAFLALPYIIPSITVAGFGTALLLAIFWGILNVTLKPLLILITLPINILTLGIFTFVINGLLLWFMGSILEGFEVAGFGAAFLGGLFLSIVSVLVSWVFEKTRE